MRNHYYTLGLSETASQDEIKQAFKRLAVKYHPDKHMGNREMEEKFKSINEAYQILGDPYKKAQFDLQLQYERFTPKREQPAQPYNYPPRQKRYGGRPYYGTRPINHKENNRATMYAFAITFGIALVVMVVKGFYDLYLQKKYEAFLAERREVFNEAKGLYDADDIRGSLFMLSDLAPFRSEEQDMKEYQNDALESIMFKGEDHYLNQDFENAARYFELVEQFSSYRPMAIKARLAQSYRHTDRPEKSIRMLKELIESRYKVVATLVQIAEVYDEELNDLEKTRDYLELARDVTIRDYEKRFGKAYAVFLTEEWVPYDHYYLFENLGNLYNRLDQPDQSIGATNWMKRIWEDSAQSWVISAKSYELKNQNSRACNDYNVAAFMGYDGELPLFCH